MPKRLYAQTYEKNTNYGRLKKPKYVSGFPKNIGKMKLAGLVKRMISSKAEAKEVLTSLTSTLNATQSNVILISGVAEGTDYNQRVGRSVSHKYIQIRVIINQQPQSAAANTFGDAGFWSIVLDRQPNGALSSFTNIYDTSAGAAVPGLAFRNTALYQDRFIVLAREEWSTGSTVTGNVGSTGGSGAAPYVCERFVDLTKKIGRDGQQKFNGTDATISSINEGALLFVVASSNSTANVPISVIGNAKYRFTDM